MIYLTIIVRLSMYICTIAFVFLNNPYKKMRRSAIFFGVAGLILAILNIGLALFDFFNY